MNRKKILREIRTACIEVGLKVKGRPIRLADMLHVIRMKNPYSYLFDLSGQMWVWHSNSEPKSNSSLVWNCVKDDLILQSENMIEFIHGTVAKK